MCGSHDSRILLKSLRTTKTKATYHKSNTTPAKRQVSKKGLHRIVTGFRMWFLCPFTRRLTFEPIYCKSLPQFRLDINYYVSTSAKRLRWRSTHAFICRHVSYNIFEFIFVHAGCAGWRTCQHFRAIWMACIYRMYHIIVVRPIWMPVTFAVTGYNMLWYLCRFVIRTLHYSYESALMWIQWKYTSVSASLVFRSVHYTFTFFIKRFNIWLLSTNHWYTKNSLESPNIRTRNIETLSNQCWNFITTCK